MSVTQLEPCPGDDPFKRKAYSEPGPVEEAGDQPIYKASKIVDSRIVNSVKHYRVKWKGYAPTENIWQTLKDVEGAQELVQEYEDRQSHSRRR